MSRARRISFVCRAREQAVSGKSGRGWIDEISSEIPARKSWLRLPEFPVPSRLTRHPINPRSNSFFHIETSIIAIGMVAMLNMENLVESSEILVKRTIRCKEKVKPQPIILLVASTKNLFPFQAKILLDSTSRSEWTPRFDTTESSDSVEDSIKTAQRTFQNARVNKEILWLLIETWQDSPPTRSGNTNNVPSHNERRNGTKWKYPVF